MHLAYVTFLCLLTQQHNGIMNITVKKRRGWLQDNQENVKTLAMMRKNAGSQSFFFRAASSFMSHMPLILGSLKERGTIQMFVCQFMWTPLKRGAEKLRIHCNKISPKSRRSQELTTSICLFLRKHLLDSRADLKDLIPDLASQWPGVV